MFYSREITHPCLSPMCPTTKFYYPYKELINSGHEILAMGTVLTYYQDRDHSPNRKGKKKKQTKNTGTGTHYFHFSHSYSPYFLITLNKVPCLLYFKHHLRVKENQRPNMESLVLMFMASNLRVVSVILELAGQYQWSNEPSPSPKRKLRQTAWQDPHFTLREGNFKTILSFVLLIIFLSSPVSAYKSLLFIIASQSTSLLTRWDAN